jgi:hypothetical protein
MIVHIQVGNKDFIPTIEDLQKVVEEFQKDVPVMTMPVKVNTLMMGDSLSKFGLHETERLMIQAGGPNWSPTKDEIDALREQFRQAQSDENGAVVATRYEVKVVIVPTAIKQGGPQ